MALYRVNIPCNINVVLVVFCLHMFVAAKQLNSQTLEIKEKDTRWKKEQKTRAMNANANRTVVDRAHLYTIQFTMLEYTPNTYTYAANSSRYSCSYSCYPIQNILSYRTARSRWFCFHYHYHFIHSINSIKQSFLSRPTVRTCCSRDFGLRFKMQLPFR